MTAVIAILLLVCAALGAAQYCLETGFTLYLWVCALLGCTAGYFLELGFLGTVALAAATAGTFYLGSLITAELTANSTQP